MFKKIIFVFFIISFYSCLHAQNIELSSLYNSIGVSIKNIGNADSCTIECKELNNINWILAFPPDKIEISDTEMFRGSIFLLKENTSYQVKATIHTGTSSKTFPVLQQSTQKIPEFSQTTNVKWVSPNGTGDYTKSNPGSLDKLFTTSQIQCGTTVIFTDGIYKSSDLQLNIKSACTENTPIILMSAQGAKPIIDGGVSVTSTWTLHSSVANLYYTSIPASAAHSNLCILGNNALYPYPSLTSEVLLGGYNLVDLNFGYDGFVRDENTIWIKTQKGINPNDSLVTLSGAYKFLTLYGNNNNVFFKVKGLSFRNFAKPVLNSLGSTPNSYSATVFDIRNAHQIYFDSCEFKYNTSFLTFGKTCNNITIQNSTFKHDIGKWSHAMIKKSNSYVHSIIYTISSSRGRQVEFSAIFLEQGKNIIIKNNLFDGLNSGVESYIDIGLKEEVDIYNNTFIDNFDAIECDGLWSNLRVWNNEIIKPMAAISAAPPLIGPRYFYRNTIHGMQGRRNEQDDPYFIGCKPVGTNYMGQSLGIKTNPKYTGTIALGNLYFFNNTFHSKDTLGFVIASWEAEWRKAVFINNSYSHSLIYPFFYFSLANITSNSKFQISSLFENYYSYNNNSPIVKIKHIHGQYNCSEVKSVTDLQNTLSSISGSPNILIQNPSQSDPYFVNTDAGGFELKNNSKLIDAGMKIPGFYDYNGKFPDIGAKESKFISSTFVNNTKPDFKIYPNPAQSTISIELSNNLVSEKIIIYDKIGKKVFSDDSTSKILSEININSLINGFYIVEIKCKEFDIYKSFIKISY
ncbi:MAG: T9SS type A sorting domain-containing protein [Bacteroidia bacterium]|nr:T9SS type A sorting domain-containing protein [Bacteroidia bacterium]